MHYVRGVRTRPCWPLVLTSFVLLSACRSERAPTTISPTVAPPAPASAASSAPAQAAAPTSGLSGDVLIPDDAVGTGRLAMSWRTTEEEREIAADGMSLTMIRRMLERFVVDAADVDLAATKRVPYALPLAPKDAVPVAVLDREHTFWDSFLGGGKGLVGTGAAGGGAVRVAQNPVDTRPRKERCAGERYELIVIEDPQLGKRRFCAYLPASFAKEPRRRYPLVLLLPGFGSGEMSYLAGSRHAGERLDVIAKEMAREAVLVGVDTSVPLGSTYLEDSPVMGAWETFLATKVLPTLDRKLRILPGRWAHALMGQSTGGYNALSFGLRHSDLFSAIGSSSPDAPDVERWLLKPGTRQAQPWLLGWARLEAAVGGAGQMTSWAASWSTDPTAPRGFRFPLDLETGLADEAILARWVAKTPHGLVRDPAFVARAKRDLSGRILIIVGKNDDFDLFAPAESFAKELSALGVETRFVATEHGHAGYLERFEPTLRFLLERLDRAK